MNKEWLDQVGEIEVPKDEVILSLQKAISSR